MKTNLKQSFLHVFAGDATPVQIGQVFLLILLPVLAAVLTWLGIHGVK